MKALVIQGFFDSQIMKKNIIGTLDHRCSCNAACRFF